MIATIGIDIRIYHAIIKTTVGFPKTFLEKEN
jgi:hypothetical protein